LKRITTRDELKELADELGVRPDWHEPDEQNVTVATKGRSFDTAGFWPEPTASGLQERHVIIKQNGKPVAAVNLAVLFAWATGYGD
jgi:hypothetical protein